MFQIKGAFGTAVLYRKKSDGLLVVLKEINMNDLSASERQLAINEVKVLKILNHQNIISYYDSFESDGELYIEMEYADAGTLADFLAQLSTPLQENEILSIFGQIVSAITHLHENNVLHRDIKTANIFLNKEGYIKVGDFGISKMLTSRRDAESCVGTPYYISPEIVINFFSNDQKLNLLFNLIELITISAKESFIIKNQTFGRWVVFSMKWHVFKKLLKVPICQR